MTDAIWRSPRSRIIYGDQLPASPEATNHRGRVYRAYDGASVATTLAFDFKGQPTSEQRQLVSNKTTRPDWSALLGQSTIPDMATAAASLLDAETFSASSNRDALGRVLTAISPDNSAALYIYDQGGALQKVELKHRASTNTTTFPPASGTLNSGSAIALATQKKEQDHASNSRMEK